MSLSDEQDQDHDHDRPLLPIAEDGGLRDISLPAPSGEERASGDVKGPNNIDALDGLRGLAALIVCFWHWTLYFYDDRIWRLCNEFPYSLLINGPFMVSMFFVLSGRVLADSLYRARRTRGTEEFIGKLVSAVVRRPFRLALPVVILGVLFCLIKVTHIMPLSMRLFEAFVRPHVTSTWITQANLANFLQFGMPDAAQWVRFWLYSGPGHDLPYDYPVLWTLPAELKGSYMVFFTALVTSQYDGAGLFVLLVGCALVTKVVDWSAFNFLGGLLLCHIHHSSLLQWVGDYGSALPKLPPRVYHVLVQVSQATLLLIGLVAWSSINVQILVPNRIKTYLMTRWNLHNICAVGALGIVYWVEHNSLGRRVMGSWVFRYLGRISFGLYLCHPIVFSTFGTGFLSLFGYAFPSMAYEDVVAISVVLSTGVAIAGGHLFDRYIDRPCVRFSHTMWNLFDSQSHRAALLSRVIGACTVGFLWMKSLTVVAKVQSTLDTVKRYVRRSAGLSEKSGSYEAVGTIEMEA